MQTSGCVSYQGAKAGASCFPHGTRQPTREPKFRASLGLGPSSDRAFPLRVFSNLDVTKYDRTPHKPVVSGYVLNSHCPEKKILAGCLVDSGADRCIIPIAYLHRAGINKLDYHSRPVYGVTGEVLEILGEIPVTLLLGDKTYTYPFLVCPDYLPITSGLILGFDFFDFFNFSLDGVTHHLVDGKNRIPYGDKKHDPSIFLVSEAAEPSRQ